MRRVVLTHTAKWAMPLLMLPQSLCCLLKETASAPHSSPAIAWDEPPAAEQLKGKNIEGSLGFSWLLVRLVFLINLVLSFEDVSAVGV